MTEQEIREFIQRELPRLIQDASIRDFVLRTVSEHYAGKQETESRFDRILRELREDREAQARKWDEQKVLWDEQNRKWDEQNRKWDEANARYDRVLEEIRAMNRKHDSTIGALGARWGLYSEETFRNALKGILRDSFGVEVLSVTEYDDSGEVFGRPEQVELDLIIRNGTLIICEIKSSFSKADVYGFYRKVLFYEKRHDRTANRRLIISPMVSVRAREVAGNIGIEVYSYAEDVPDVN